MKSSLASLLLVICVASGCVQSRECRFSFTDCARGPSYDNLISHRGESVDAPENTMPAYKTAVDRGFGFECDVYLSIDGRVYTFHDGNLKRTSAGKKTKRCTEASWEKEVSTLNVGGWGKWKGSKFDPTRPALLEEVCTLARPGRKIYCEVKGGDIKVVAPIAKILASQKNANPDNFLFIAFNKKMCAELKRVLPQYKCHWLTDAYHYTWYNDGRRPLRGAPVQTNEILSTLQELGVDGVDVSFDMGLHTPDFIQTIHRAGYEFHVWTIDDPARAREAFRRGVDTVTTNCAKRILEDSEGK